MKLFDIPIKLGALVFFWDLMFIYAVDKLFFLSRGISLVEISVLMSIWAVSTILFEIPTGILADRWNRKHMLVIAGVTRTLLCLSWLFIDNMIGFAIGFIFLAISQSFLSGTTQAYLYDALSKTYDEDKFEVAWGRIEASRMIALSIAWAVGGIVSVSSFSPALVLSLLSGVLCTTVALTLPSITRKKLLKEQNPFKHILETLKYAFHHEILFRVLLFSLIVRSTYVVIDEYWAVYFSTLTVSPAIFGILVGVSTLCGGVSGLVAHRFTKSTWRTISVGTLYFISVLLFASVTKSWIAIVLLLTLESVTSILYILMEGAIQKHADPAQRATTASVASLLKEAGIITGLAFGFFMNQYSIFAGFYFFAVFLTLYFLGLWLRKVWKHQLQQ